MSHHGGAKPGHLNPIDQLTPAIAVLSEGQMLAATANAARAGPHTTAAIPAARGPVELPLGIHHADVVDPGAEVIARVFESPALRA